jgi:hypothetical protein
MMIATPAAAIPLVIRTQDLCFCLLCKLLVVDDIILLDIPSFKLKQDLSTQILLIIPSASFLWICLSRGYRRRR